MTNPLSRALPTDRLPHIYQILSSVLAGAAIWVFCWYLSQQGLLDLASTAAAAFALNLVRQLGSGLSARAHGAFSGSAKLLETMVTEFKTWVAGRKLLSHILLAAAATIAFLVVRAICAVIMSAISSPWLMAALALGVAAAVASPVLVKAIIDTVAGKSGRRTDSEDSNDERR